MLNVSYLLIFIELDLRSAPSFHYRQMTVNSFKLGNALLVCTAKKACAFIYIYI